MDDPLMTTSIPAVTPEEFKASLEWDREHWCVPCMRIFKFHPADRAMWAPLIAIAEDDVREHLDYTVMVVEDDSCVRFSQEAS